MFKKIKDDTTCIKELDALLEKRIEGKVVAHNMRPLIELGENFGSEILKTEITVEENGQKNTIQAVAKLIPQSEMQLQIFNTQVTFRNEIGFYADIVPALVEFQREYGTVSVGDYFPKLYGARTSLNPNSQAVDENAVIIMENLKISGHDNIERRVGFDLDSAKTILKALAEFHATALALRRKKPDVFHTRIKPYLTEWKPPGELPTFESVLSENPATSSLVPKVRRAMTKQRFKKIREPWATITHNDLWVNNIMIKESRHIIESLKFVDFQIIDYGSPLIDVIFFLFSSVQVPVLKYHFEKLLQYYYKEFIEMLRLFKVDTKEFTYESFLEEAKLEGSYQTAHSMFMMLVIFGPKEQKVPGKAPEWNPRKEIGGSNGHVGPPSNRILNGTSTFNGESNTPSLPDFTFPLPMKEKLWFIAEEAAKRKWI